MNWRNVPRGKRQFDPGSPDHSRRRNRENLFSLFERRRVERFCEAKAYQSSKYKPINGYFLNYNDELAERPKG